MKKMFKKIVASVMAVSTLSVGTKCDNYWGTTLNIIKLFPNIL